MIQRLLVPVLASAVLVVGAWLLWQRVRTPVVPPLPPTATASVSAPTAAATATVPRAPAAGYRLAGTAVGDPTSYAAIETPEGTSHLYRNGEDVPGLGRLTEVHVDRVVIAPADGETLTLRLQPAATPTPDRRRVDGDPRGASTPSATTAPDRIPRESPS